MRYTAIYVCFLSLLALAGCGTGSPSNQPATIAAMPTTTPEAATTAETPATADDVSATPSVAVTATIPTREPAETEAALADVLSVDVSGSPGNYQFAVEVSSPDQGCEQYANWWEVLGEDGTLLHRRILAHSHVNEQPFVRSSGPIDIQPDTRVIVRAHMFPGGYGGTALQGSVAAGFAAVELPPDFAAAVADEPPQPSGCAF
jgi:hypothetical protein